jgi:type VI secretion system protein ImpJ
MTRLSPVVWSEGMHLAQHHFQAQSRFFEESVQFALSSLFFSPYGFAGYELDAEALRNGTASLIHARGVMPDGLPFHFPDADPAPPPLELRELFSPTADSQLLLLTIPAFRRDGSNCALPSAEGVPTPDAPRFIAEEQSMVDQLTGRDAKRLALGRKNFRLALETMVRQDDVALPIARVRRDGTGSFAYDADYVPPLLQVGGSEWLVRLLARLVEILDEKSAALASGRRDAFRPSGDYAGHEIATFWLLHAIQAAVAPIRHHLQIRRSRPEAVFVELSRLAGALCTFSLDAHPRDLPAYDHENLGGCFAALERHIRTHLEVIIPTNCIAVPLRPTAPYLWAGPVADKRTFGRSRWILGVHTSLGGAATVARVPSLVKLCSAKFVPELVRRAYPGLALQHIPSPPAAISPRVDVQYFGVDKSGPCWDTIVQTGEVGIYVPDALPDAEIELKVLLDS